MDERKRPLCEIWEGDSYFSRLKVVKYKEEQQERKCSKKDNEEEGTNAWLFFYSDNNVIFTFTRI